jgi:O-antigen ligase
MLACTLAGIVMTNSRGGVLAAGIAVMLIVARTKQKLISLFFLLVMFAGSAFLVKDMFMHRMSTLAEYDQEVSAVSRIEHAKSAVRMWTDHPFFGVGFGGTNYGMLVKYYTPYRGALDNHVAHNSYLQMLVDSGPVAFVLYLSLFVYGIRSLGRMAKQTAVTSPEDAEVAAMSRGLQVSLITYAFGSTFYSAQRIDLPYILFMLAGALINIYRQRQPGKPAPTVLNFAPMRSRPAVSAR